MNDSGSLWGFLLDEKVLLLGKIHFQYENCLTKELESYERINNSIKTL